ncbi:hypothetical protein RvY_13657-2 [Ramazzottius varieornatus]|nr:hypothetical protein RvY_13657-2 [Ramazzottius varieornatus]
MIIFSVMLVYGLFHPVSPNHLRTSRSSLSYLERFSKGKKYANLSSDPEPDRFDYFSRTKVTFYPVWNSSPPLLCQKSLQMSFLGKSMTLCLKNLGTLDRDIRVSDLTSDGSEKLSLPHSDLTCHYGGTVVSCLIDNCTMGVASISDCGSGIYGFLRIEEGGFLLTPVQADEGNR